MIISKFIDEHAYTTEHIIKEFKKWCSYQDGTKLTQKQVQEIKKVCEQYPIVGILCAAFDEIGYDSF